MKKEIARKLEELRESVKELEIYRNKASSIDDLKKDVILRRAIERSLQVALECCLDIGQMIISFEGLKKPEKYKEVIEILGEKEILSKKFAKKFAPAVGFRNILVHKYTKVDLDELYKHLQKDLEDFNTFAKFITKHLKKK